jgi:hypothetical protein
MALEVVGTLFGRLHEITQRAIMTSCRAGMQAVIDIALSISRI